MIDITLFLLIGLVGLIITLVICITGKKHKQSDHDDPGLDKINFLKFSVSVILLLYIFHFQ